jgi:hypothetical protein
MSSCFPTNFKFPFLIRRILMCRFLTMLCDFCQYVCHLLQSPLASTFDALNDTIYHAPHDAFRKRMRRNCSLCRVFDLIASHIYGTRLSLESWPHTMTKKQSVHQLLTRDISNQQEKLEHQGLPLSFLYGRVRKKVQLKLIILCVSLSRSDGI